MARVNYQDCRYFIYAHYNSYYDVHDHRLRDRLRKYELTHPHNNNEYGFITGARDSFELDYIIRQLDSSPGIDYTILEQMSLLDL